MSYQGLYVTNSPGIIPNHDAALSRLPSSAPGTMSEPFSMALLLSPRSPTYPIYVLQSTQPLDSHISTISLNICTLPHCFSREAGLMIALVIHRVQLMPLLYHIAPSIGNTDTGMELKELVGRALERRDQAHIDRSH